MDSGAIGIGKARFLEGKSMSIHFDNCVFIDVGNSLEGPTQCPFSFASAVVTGRAGDITFSCIKSCFD